MTDDKLVKALLKLATAIEESPWTSADTKLLPVAERIAVALEQLVQHFCKLQPAKPLTAEQVAQRLGVSAGKVYQLVRAKSLRAIKVGRSVRFKAEDVEAYTNRVR